MNSQKHGCLYYLFIFPFLLPFYFLKWTINIGGRLFLWLLVIIIVLGIATMSVYVVIPIAIILLVYFILKPSKYKNIPDFDKMSGVQFEEFCCYLLSQNGFSDVQTTKASGDQGIDILANNNGIKYGIQCKCYSNNIGNSAIQEVFAGIHYYGCDKGVVLTNQYFTQSAISLSRSTGILLWDRNKLENLISVAYENKTVSSEIEDVEELDNKISDALNTIALVYSNAIKQFRYSEVTLVESRQYDYGYEFIYKAESQDQMDYVFTLKEDFDNNLHGIHIFEKLYDNKFLLRVYKNDPSISSDENSNEQASFEEKSTDNSLFPYGKLSIGKIQRKFQIGFNLASRIMEILYSNGMVSEKNGYEPRKLLVDEVIVYEYIENEILPSIETILEK